MTIQINTLKEVKNALTICKDEWVIFEVNEKDILVHWVADPEDAESVFSHNGIILSREGKILFQINGGLPLKKNKNFLHVFSLIGKAVRYINLNNGAASDYSEEDCTW